MTKPWEKYQGASKGKPWEKYAKPPAVNAVRPAGMASGMPAAPVTPAQSTMTGPVSVPPSRGPEFDRVGRSNPGSMMDMAVNAGNMGGKTYSPRTGTELPDTVQAADGTTFYLVPETGQYIDRAGMEAMQRQRFQSGDLGQGMAALAGATRGQSYGTVDEMFGAIGGPRKREMARATYDAARQEYPVTTIGSEIAGAVAAPGPKVARTGNLGRDVVTNSAVGSTLAGIYGAATGEGGLTERLAQVPGAAAFGAIGGAMVPAVGAVAQKAADKFAQWRAVSKAIKTAPETADLRALADDLFDAAERLGVTVKPSEFGSMATTLLADLRARGLDDMLTPVTARVMRLLDDTVQSGQPISLQAMKTLREQAGIAAAKVDVPKEAALGMKIKETLDGFVAGLTPAQLISGNATTLAPILKDARAMWSRMRKSEFVEKAMERADGGYLGGAASGIRNQLAPIIRSDKKGAGWTRGEKAAVKAVVKGSPAEQALNAASGVIGQVALTGVGAMMGNVPGAVAGAAAGMAARKGAEAVFMRNAARLRKIVASDAFGRVATAGPEARNAVEQMMQRAIAAGASDGQIRAWLTLMGQRGMNALLPLPQ